MGDASISCQKVMYMCHDIFHKNNFCTSNAIIFIISKFLAQDNDFPAF